MSICQYLIKLRRTKMMLFFWATLGPGAQPWSGDRNRTKLKTFQLFDAPWKHRLVRRSVPTGASSSKHDRPSYLP